MKTSKFFSDKILVILAVCVVVSFLAQIFEINVIVNLIYIISLFLVLGCYFLSGHVNVVTCFLIITVALSVVAKGFVSDADFFTHIIITICIFICIDVSAYVRIKPETCKKISFLFLITSIILLIAYYLGPLKNSYFRWTDVICLNFANPNTAGLWLACIFILVFNASFLFTRFKRILFLGAALGILPIVVATESRNSYLACLFLIVCVVFARIFNIKKVPKWLLAVIACLPIIVFFFYMLVIIKNMDFWQDFFSLDGIDKGIGTRVSVWDGVLENFWHYFLVGDYAEYYDGNMHNSLITVFCRHGAVTTALVCVLLYRVLKKLQDNSSFLATLSLSAILFTGCFEASIFVGIAGMYLMLLLVPVCATVEGD